MSPTSSTQLFVHNSSQKVSKVANNPSNHSKNNFISKKQIANCAQIEEKCSLIFHNEEPCQNPEQREIIMLSYRKTFGEIRERSAELGTIIARKGNWRENLTDNCFLLRSQLVAFELGYCFMLLFQMKHLPQYSVSVGLTLYNRHCRLCLIKSYRGPVQLFEVLMLQVFEVAVLQIFTLSSTNNICKV